MRPLISSNRDDPGMTLDQVENPSGSPLIGEPEFLAVGKLRRPHGTHGEILMEVLTDFPERLEPGVIVYIGSRYQPVTLRSRRWHNQALLVAFEEIADRERVGVFRNQFIFVRADDRPELPEGDYYHHQILGLQVITEFGKHLGVVKEILETGANDVYVVEQPDGHDILIPAVDEFILGIDLEKGEMRVHIVPGILPDSPSS